MTQGYSDAGWMMECIGRLYEHSPAIVETLYRESRPFLRPWRNLHTRLEILTGPTHWHRQAGRILYAGSNPMADPFPKQFFIGEPKREKIGSCPIWSLAKTLNRMQSTVDLTFVFIDWISARLLLGDDYLVLPNGVSLVCHVPKDAFQIGRATGSAREDLRKIGQQGLTYEISHRDDDLRQFYEQYYVPYLQSRHKASAIIRTRYFLRRGFRHGGLLWISHDGRRVAGVVIEIRGNKMNFLALGQNQAAPSASLPACYNFALHYALARKLTHVDFGGCAASPADGLFRYKLKWGSSLDPGYTSPYRFLLRWTRMDDCMADFFFRSPVFFYDRGGELSAMACVTDQDTKSPETVKKLQQLFAVPGLHRGYIISPRGWNFDPAASPYAVDGAKPAQSCPILFCSPSEFADQTGIRSWSVPNSAEGTEPHSR